MENAQHEDDGYSAGVRIVAHDHARHDLPYETPHGFETIAVESMRRMRYDVKTATWTEDRVDIKVEGYNCGTGGLKTVQRAFQRGTGSTADDGGRTGVSASGFHADWVALVLKEYFGEVLDILKLSGQGVVDQFKRDVCMQLEAKALANAYNACNPPKKIEVIEPVILFRDSGEVYFAEPLLLGTFFKHNDPAANILGMQEGFADDHNYIRMTPQAFSHFSWHHTGGQKLVMDVQGVGDVYTDPQIISAEGGRYGLGGLDSGTTGLVFFACSHVCNPICEELGLSPFHLSPREVDRISWLWDGTHARQTARPFACLSRSVSAIDTAVAVPRHEEGQREPLPGGARQRGEESAAIVPQEHGRTLQHVAQCHATAALSRRCRRGHRYEPLQIGRRGTPRARAR